MDSRQPAAVTAIGRACGRLLGGGWSGGLHSTRCTNSCVYFVCETRHPTGFNICAPAAPPHYSMLLYACTCTCISDCRVVSVVLYNYVDRIDICIEYISLINQVLVLIIRESSNPPAPATGTPLNRVCACVLVLGATQSHCHRHHQLGGMRYGHLIDIDSILMCASVCPHPAELCKCDLDRFDLRIVNGEPLTRIEREHVGYQCSFVFSLSRTPSLWRWPLN